MKKVSMFFLIFVYFICGSIIPVKAETKQNYSIETEEQSQLKENILNSADDITPPSDEEKNMKFEMGDPSMVTLYTLNEQGNPEEISNFNFNSMKEKIKSNPDSYLVCVKIGDQTNIWSKILEVIELNESVGFKLDLQDYVTYVNGEKLDYAYVNYGKKSEDGNVETSYLTMKESTGDEFAAVEDYNSEMKTAYENLRKLMPFYDRSIIVKEGNKLSKDHELNTYKILASYPLDESGKRIVGSNEEQVATVNKIHVKFAEKDSVPVEYNINYINTRNNIASYSIPQLNIHYNYDKFIVKTESQQFNSVLNIALSLEYDKDIATRVKGSDAASVSSLYKDNFDSVVKQEMKQVLLSMFSNQTNYPVNMDTQLAKNIVQKTLVDSNVLKDFLYVYNYIDKWYDFEISDINIRDVVLFDNSVLKSANDPSGLVSEICLNTDSNGRKGNNTPTLYKSRIAKFTEISDIASFLEYFISEYAGYDNVDNWIVDNFKNGIIVDVRSKNNSINSTAWSKIKSNTYFRDQQMILPVLSYKADKALYIASAPTVIIYGNLRNYGSAEDVSNESWRQQKKNQLQSICDDIRNIFDNYITLSSHATKAINESKFAVIDRSNGLDLKQPVFSQFYKPLECLVGGGHGAAVSIRRGGHTVDYIYFNNISVIGNEDALIHEIGHVTDSWIWLEGRGLRSGRSGEDYNNGFANQYSVDYNMNLMKNYDRSSDKLSNLTPERINTQEKFKSYYKEVFDTLYILDYLQGKAFLELTPNQQAAITLKHSYKGNSSTSKWSRVSAQDLENMKLETLDDLWDNQLSIRPGIRIDLSSQTEVGVNYQGAYQLDRVRYTSWYIPYNDNGSPNAQTFRRNAFELGGYFGYTDGTTEYLSNMANSGDLAYYRKKFNDPNLTFESYRKNKNKEVELWLQNMSKMENSYFDEKALIEYFKNAMINPGNAIDSGSSNFGNTLNNIKDARENIFRYLQRVTNEFNTPVTGDDSTRTVTHIKTAQDLVDKITENPDGFYILDNDISLEEISVTDCYINKTFIGKIEGNGHKITGAKAPLFKNIRNSYVADLTIINQEGQVNNNLLANSIAMTIRLNEQKVAK